MYQGMDLSGTLSEVLLQKYGLKVLSHRRLQSYMDHTYHVTVDTYVENPYITKFCRHGYVAKFVNEEETERKNIAGQVELIVFARKAGLSVPKAVQNKDGAWTHRVSVSAPNGEKTLPLFYLLEYIPAQMMSEVDINKNMHLLTDLGHMAGKMDKAMKDFQSEKMENVCYCQCIPDVLSELNVFDDDHKRIAAKNIIAKFQEKVLSNLENASKGILHQDLNPLNILVQNDDTKQWRLSAVIDFGASTYSYYVFEVAIIIAQALMCWRTLDVGEVKPLVLNAYLEEVQLSTLELEMIDICVIARMVQSYFFAKRSLDIHPENKYVKQYMHWNLVMELWERFSE